jgi:hypothetical protein
MKARRIPIPPNGDIFAALEKPGDYCGPAEGTIGKPPDGLERIPVRRVAFMLPIETGNVFHCQEPPHKFTEELDGTLTITASILASWGNKDNRQSWHGFLTKGEWITA